MSLFAANHLSVSRGGKPIVNDVTFDVDRGQVLGLIGPNGAGKSTTLGGILGFYPLAGGSIVFDGHTFDQASPLSPEAKAVIAHIPEQPMYYSDLTLQEHLLWKQRLWHRYKDSNVESRMRELMDAFELSPHADKFPHQCSKGTLQKLMIVSAFMFPFQLLVVDEPFLGLDIVSIRRLKDYINRAQTNGAAILISTHVLDAAEKMCSHFVLLHQGHTIRNGSLLELKQQAAELTAAQDASLEDLFVALVESQRAAQAHGGSSC